tara:strand:- start:845 stop:1411 length:567 start_codon:yes stop_codon:yes gene_type:complete
MKKRTIKIKPVGMVFKVEKKLAGGLLRTGIKAAVRSEPFRRFKKKLAAQIKKAYDPEIKKRTGAAKSEIKGLRKLDTQRLKAKELLNMTQFVLGRSRKAGVKRTTQEMRKTRRALINYVKNEGKKAKAMFDKQSARKKGIKLNSKGGIQNVANKLKKASKAHAAQAVTLEKIAKKSTGGMADYYKDIL